MPRYGDAFPAAYRDDFSARAAVADIQRIERLDPEGDLDLSLYLPLEAAAGHLGFKLLRSGSPILLSDVLPLLENMGVKVTDERPFEVRAAGRAPVWIYDFGLDARCRRRVPGRPRARDLPGRVRARLARRPSRTTASTGSSSAPS